MTACPGRPARERDETGDIWDKESDSLQNVLTFCIKTAPVKLESVSKEVSMERTEAVSHSVQEG